ncbi:MAG: flagellar hook-basal body complex protein (FliE) [Firmicutes bacterium]|nr:flagellar hook-basal body complex protein (FliE) [Bacillota bacterium]
MANVINSYSSIMDRYSSMISQVETGGQETSDQVSGSFEGLLSSQIEKLNGVQVQADNMIADFAAGNTDDLHQVMIAAEEASMSMELAVQIRNKIVDAYKELNNMQL